MSRIVVVVGAVNIMRSQVNLLDQFADKFSRFFRLTRKTIWNCKGAYQKTELKKQQQQQPNNNIALCSRVENADLGLVWPQNITSYIYYDFFLVKCMMLNGILVSVFSFFIISFFQLLLLLPYPMMTMMMMGSVGCALLHTKHHCTMVLYSAQIPIVQTGICNEKKKN